MMLTVFAKYSTGLMLLVLSLLRSSSARGPGRVQALAHRPGHRGCRRRDRPVRTDLFMPTSCTCSGSIRSPVSAGGRRARSRRFSSRSILSSPCGRVRRYHCCPEEGDRLPGARLLRGVRSAAAGAADTVHAAALSAVLADGRLGYLSCPGCQVRRFIAFSVAGRPWSGRSSPIFPF